MDTTTSDSGVSQDTQPTTTEAVTDDVALPITTDENGTPTIGEVTVSEEVASTDTSSADEPAAEEPQAQEAQADEADIQAWAEKKGLPLDDPLKLAKMYRDAEKHMHEVTQRTVQPPEQLEPTGDSTYDTIIERQNANDMRIYVRDWFDANPEMKDHKTELSRIAQERPWLQDMDDVKAHFLADPTRAASLKKEGGREALQTLAQKQQQVPPTAGATNSAEYQTAQITPQNVFELIDKNDQAWFEKNHDKINKAISGK